MTTLNTLKVPACPSVFKYCAFSVLNCAHNEQKEPSMPQQDSLSTLKPAVAYNLGTTISITIPSWHPRAFIQKRSQSSITWTKILKIKMKLYFWQENYCKLLLCYSLIHHIQALSIICGRPIILLHTLFNIKIHMAQRKRKEWCKPHPSTGLSHKV